MKLKYLRNKLAKVPDDFDLELFIGHCALEPAVIEVAQFGKVVSIHALDPGQPTWTKELPKESGSYWWWNGDEDSNPAHIELGKSLPSGDVFATAGQYGWTRAQNVSEMGGWWMPLITPPTPHANE